MDPSAWLADRPSCGVSVHAEVGSGRFQFAQASVQWSNRRDCRLFGKKVTINTYGSVFGIFVLRMLRTPGCRLDRHAKAKMRAS
jgi:hypothetical protein